MPDSLTQEGFLEDDLKNVDYLKKEHDLKNEDGSLLELVLMMLTFLSTYSAAELCTIFLSKIFGKTLEPDPSQ